MRPVDIRDHIPSNSTSFEESHKKVAFLKYARVCTICKEIPLGSHRVLQYITGYSTKASDSLTFHITESESHGSQSRSAWATTYRMMTRRAPLEPELTLEMMGLPLMDQSFQRDTLYAPIPTLPGKAKPTNNHRRVYEMYLRRQCWRFC